MFGRLSSVPAVQGGGALYVMYVICHADISLFCAGWRGTVVAMEGSSPVITVAYDHKADGVHDAVPIDALRLPTLRNGLLGTSWWRMDPHEPQMITFDFNFAKVCFPQNGREFPDEAGIQLVLRSAHGMSGLLLARKGLCRLKRQLITIGTEACNRGLHGGGNIIHLPKRFSRGRI